MSITEERAAALQEILADWRQADPEQVWDAFDFEDFNEMVGDLAALLAEVERLRNELAKARAVTEDKVKRAKRAFGAATAVTSSIPLGMSEHAFIQGVAIQHGYAIRIALQTALGGGGDA